MKTAIIAKATAVVLACSILAIFLVPAGFAFRAIDSVSNPASIQSCNNRPDTLTIFPYTKFDMGRNGSVETFEVHVSSFNGNCTAKIYSSRDGEYVAPENANGVIEKTVALR
jgi:hypothetical protein